MLKYGVEGIIFLLLCMVYGQFDVFFVMEEVLIKKVEFLYGNIKQINEEIICDIVVLGLFINVIMLCYFNFIGVYFIVLIGELFNGVL